ncbi:aldehyde dehydrogenase (NADP(+)) [Nocardioides sp. zg-1228]|uniref:aldehyde dehydrogenase (NADP(+)) n=1 Tax=Nocardioides sp. zg-1228 TaxID=2763008 RepID=UPI00164364FA|nr:aldehyde dehydrogenase (NADP(+)) [Nocardioides sp. zg-1228]MBC2931759.1 aldehyde dehydrogenase (NADP(+)) [Nocardioides sp. zg-1228]
MTDSPTITATSIIAGADSEHPDVAAATTAAAHAFTAYRATTPEERGAFLEAVASEIESDKDAIIVEAVRESGLPEGRITGEVGRTTGQLRLFAGVVRQGDHLGVRIDPALPERTPLPRADIRQRMVPLGPVAVFGASNFPLAFSTAGGDTASALAAGCPVVVKGHPAHPVTGTLVARAITRAVERAGLPAGTFSFVLGGIETGQELVTDPRIAAVGFTGSRGGGLALVRAAAEREVPIPVYAEMSSINPVVVLPGALEGDVAALAEAYVGSLTLGSGQFCTNPGLLFLPSGERGDAFLRAAGEAVGAATGQPMLTPGIAEAYASGTASLRGTEGVRVVGEGSAAGEHAPAPGVYEAPVELLAIDDSTVTDEVFGAAGVVVRYDDVTSLLPRLEGLEGQLTATVHATDADVDDARALLPVLELKAGRVLFNGWPTGVEVGHAMVHGGPYPATSDSRTTSVGSLAIERFQRPVAYQDVPAALLPAAVRDDNPWGLRRRIDGDLE